MPVEPSDDNFWQGVGHMSLELRVKSIIPLPARSRDSARGSSVSGQPEQALPVWSFLDLGPQYPNHVGIMNVMN